MPAIRGIYYSHPQTAEAGYWIELLDGKVIGMSQKQLDAIKLTGSTTQRMAQLKVAVIADFQPKLETKTALSTYSAEDQAWMIANPEPYCRVEGSDYVAQDSVISVEVLGLNPIRLQLTVSEGACRSVIEYE